MLAAAAKQFQKFYESEIFSEIVNSFATVCELLEVQPGSFAHFYPELKVLKTSLVYLMYYMNIMSKNANRNNPW